MPVAKFEMPDGRIGRFEVPEGTTAEQAQSLIMESMAEQPSVEKQIPQWGQENPRTYEALQTARQYGAPIVEGLGMVGGGLIGAPAGPVGAVGGAGLGYGAARELVNMADVALGNKQRQELPEQAKEAAKNVLEGMTYEAGGRVAGDVLGGIAKNIPESVKVTPEKLATFLRSSEAGYVVPPSQMKPSWGMRALESVSGKAETAHIASLKNQEVTNKLARQALGIAPEVPLTQESMQSYRKAQHGMGYDPVRDVGIVNLGKSFNESLDDIIKANTGQGSIPAAENKEVTELVNSFKTKGVTFVNSSDVVDAIRVLRENADKAFKNNDAALGKANRKIAEKYEDSLDNALQQFKQPELLENYRNARQNIAKSFSVESALKEGSGNVDAKKLASLLQKGKPLSGELETAARFGNVFDKAARTPEQVGSVANNLRPVSAVIGGSLGGLPTAAAIMGAPALAQSAMFSKALQSRLGQTAQPAMTAEALRRYAPNAVRSLPIIGNQFTGNE